MAEERFTSKVVDWWHNVDKTRVVFDNGEWISADECAKLLNKLNDENIELHIQNDFLKDENIHMRQALNENKQLKQQISYYEKLIADKEVEWLRNNTVWEQMPSSKRTITKTSK